MMTMMIISFVTFPLSGLSIGLAVDSVFVDADDAVTELFVVTVDVEGERIRIVSVGADVSSDGRRSPVDGRRVIHSILRPSKRLDPFAVAMKEVPTRISRQRVLVIFASSRVSRRLKGSNVIGEVFIGYGRYGVGSVHGSGFHGGSVT